MLRKLLPFVILLALVGGAFPAAAQSEPDAWANYQLNMRAGPDTTQPVVSVLEASAGVVIEGRTEDANWLLARSLSDGSRGWVAALYLRYRDGFAVHRIAVSGEIIAAPPSAPAPESAPENAPAADAAPATGPHAWTSYALNLRAGSDSTQPVLAMLDANTALTISARSSDNNWLLATTPDGVRGWVSALHVQYAPGFSAFALPVSDEVIAVQSSAPENAPAANESAPANGALAAYLDSIPVIPSISARAAAIYSGSNLPHRFSKVGDCNSYDWAFMAGFDTGQYDLGANQHLQATIDYFRGSFGRTSAAAHVGFNALSVLDASWADPALCEAGESSVWCELRAYQPAVVVIMFGANDVYNLSAEQYASSLRQIVDWSIRNGTIPVLSTFAWCGGGAFGDKALQLNALTVDIAREYDIPLINFWKAAQALPNCGMGADGIHLSTAGPPYGCYLTGDEAQAGFTLRSMVTLQTLDAIRQAALP